MRRRPAPGRCACAAALLLVCGAARAVASSNALNARAGGGLPGDALALAARRARLGEDALELPAGGNATEPPVMTCAAYPGVWAELAEHQPFAKPAGAHKPLFPLSKGDIIGFVLTVLVLFIAAGGGIGGGGAIIPLYLLFLGFKTDIAVALGNITIVGGALSNFAFNAPRRHSIFNRPLIDWDLILVMEPSTILGALVGGYLNKILPNWITTALLALLLTFISYKLVVRGVLTWQKESAERAPLGDSLRQPLLAEQAASGQAAGNAAPAPAPSQPIPGRADIPAGDLTDHSPLAYTGSLSASFQAGFRRPGSQGAGSAEGGSPRGPLPLPQQPPAANGAAEAEAPQLLSAGAIDEEAPALHEGEDAGKKQEELDLLFAERRQIPPVRFGILVLLTLVVGVSDYLKGRVRCGSLPYWLLVAAILPAVLLVTFGGRSYLLKKRKKKQAADYIVREGDVDWNPVTTLTYPVICSLAGLVAGMFGVGGGIVKGPLMLELGVLPDVASATSATMIVFTSASASIVFLSFGGIPTDYAVAVFLLGLVFTMLGQVACYALMRLLRRRSVIVFAMAALMLISMVIVDYEAVIGVLRAAKEHRLWAFSTLCSRRGG